MVTTQRTETPSLSYEETSSTDVGRGPHAHIAYTDGCAGFCGGATTGQSGSASGRYARQTSGDTVRAIRPVLPLSRTTVRAVAAGVRQVVDASVVAVNTMIRATVDFAGAVLGVTGTTLTAARAVAESAVAGLNTIVAAVDATLDNLSDVNLTAAVDASLQASVS